MDRSYEPSIPYVECKTIVRMVDLNYTPRPWSMPVPLRVKHSGFKSLGVSAPVPLNTNKSACFTLPLRGSIQIILDPNNGYWLVQTLSLPAGETPTELHGKEAKTIRVDGGPCKGHLTFSSVGGAYLANINIGRETLRDMADQVMKLDPDSRILVRLLPRYGQGVVRWFEKTQCLQFWTPL